MTGTTTPTRSDVLRALADRVERTPNVEGEAARFQRLAFDLKCAFEDITLIHAGHLLTSLDATEALRQAVLPGWTLAVRPEGDGLIRAELGRGHEWGDPFVEPHMGRSATERAARLAALLRALAAEMEARS